MMRNARNIMMYMSAVVLLLSGVIMSCSTVEYGYVDTGEADHSNPSISEVCFNFDWKDIAAGDIPNELSVVMSRVVNTVHYVYALNQDGVILESHEALPEPEEPSQTPEQAEGDVVQQAVKSEETPDDALEQEVPKASTDTILNGDYYVLALARTGKKYSYQVDGMAEFEDSLSISMKDLYATIPQVPEEELIEAEIVDFNPMYPFIYSAEPLYLEVKKQSIYPQEEVNLVTLTPQLLTNRITFKIHLTSEEEVEIKRIIGIISGVPAQVQLMSGVVSRYNTSKVFFEMFDGGESSGNGHTYVGEVDVLGLFAATKPGFITGPGILQIILDASVSGSGKRRFFASINLKETIEKADLMIETDDHLGFRCTGDALLEVPTELIVSKDQILSGGGNGLEVWYDNEERIETEI